MNRTLISAAVIVGLSSFSFAQDNSGRTRDDQMQEQSGRIIIKDTDDQTTGTDRKTDTDTTRIRTETQTRTERDTTGTSGVGASGRIQAGDAGASGGAAMQAGARGTAQIDTNETIKALNSSNEFEIQLSQYVQQNGQDPQVKQLAEQMVRDHRQAQQQLKQLAQKKNVQLDSELMEHHQAALDHFKSKKGAELDAMYSFHEAGHHMHSVLKHQYLSSHAQDQDLRQFAQNLLPTLQQHLQQVTTVAQGIAGAEGSAMPASGRMEGSMNNTETNRTRTEIRSSGTTGTGTTGAGATGAGATGSADTKTGATYDSNVAGPRDQAGEDTGTRHDAGTGTTGNRTGGTGTGAAGDANR